MKSRFGVVVHDIQKHKVLALMALPVLAFFLIFHYVPMYGVIIAFKDYNIARGVLDSPWVGFKYFRLFFQSAYFVRILKNTLLLSLYDLFFGFPAPILLALLLNEIGNRTYKKVIQTTTYLPHFISMVIICGIIVDFTATNGLINDMLALFNVERSNLLVKARLFRPIYVTSQIWQTVGWSSIIYLAALSNIDPDLYAAAYVDGAGRFRQAVHVTLPGISPTIVILLILRIGSMLSVSFEKVLLLYSPLTYEVADVIATYVYRRGIVAGDYSYSTAVGLFNSVINLFLLITANKISRAVSDKSLW